jgi:hypothetical protein
LGDRIGRLALTLLFCLLSAGAHAALITWSFTGVVRDIPYAAPPPAVSSLGVVVGAGVTGYVQFDSATPPLVPGDTIVGNYAGAVVNAALHIGAWSLTIDPTGGPGGTEFNSVVVSQTSGGFGSEFLQATMDDPTGSINFPGMAVELSQRAGTLWPGNAMLLTPPALSELDPYGRSSLSVGGFGTDLAIYDGAGMELHAQLTSLLPEPQIAGLMALVFAGLAVARPV